jgi:hypothetical protein
MSTIFQDISYDLIDGIYTALTNVGVTFESVTYPVYKSVPKTPPPIYVFVGNVIQTEDGTKENFHYSGTVQVHVVDESKERADLKLAQSILNVTRFILKITKSTVFDIQTKDPGIWGTVTLVIFSHDTFNYMVSQAANGISNIRVLDTYNFLIN